MSEPEEDEDNNVYVIESVKAKRVVGGEVQFLVRWRGYDTDDDTWEPLENFNDPEDYMKYERTLPPEQQGFPPAPAVKNKRPRIKSPTQVKRLLMHSSDSSEDSDDVKNKDDEREKERRDREDREKKKEKERRKEKEMRREREKREKHKEKKSSLHKEDDRKGHFPFPGSSKSESVKRKHKEQEREKERVWQQQREQTKEKERRKEKEKHREKEAKENRSAKENTKKGHRIRSALRIVGVKEDSVDVDEELAMKMVVLFDDQTAALMPIDIVRQRYPNLLLSFFEQSLAEIPDTVDAGATTSSATAEPTTTTETEDKPETGKEVFESVEYVIRNLLKNVEIEFSAHGIRDEGKDPEVVDRAVERVETAAGAVNSAPSGDIS